MSSRTPSSASAATSASGGSGGLRSLLNDLNTSAGALAALGAALDARASGRPLAPSLGAPVRGVLDALGASEAVEQLESAELRVLLAEIRVFAASHARFEAPLSPGTGWAPPSPELIQAAGDASAGLPRTIERVVAPRLDGLAARLDAFGGRFLDVGAGAAALSIEMARQWPRLAIVGIEPWAPALELAHANVSAAGLAERIELRATCGERLTDDASYDLAWIPSLFIPAPVLPTVFERVARSLRPGGWLLLPVLRAEPGSLTSSVVRLRSALWGGSAPTLAEASVRLSTLGLTDMQSFASAPSSTTGLLAARRGEG
jgi:precorrin-6B methylase 2